MWYPTECIHLSCILTIFCTVVLIARWYSKTTEACSYTKIKHASRVLKTVSDLFFNKSSSLKWNPREIEPNISADYLPSKYTPSVCWHPCTNMHTVISQKAGTDTSNLSDFCKWGLKLTQRRAVVVISPVCPLTSAIFSDVTQPRLVVSYQRFGHAMGRIFKSQATTAWPMVYMYFETSVTTKPRCVATQKSEDHKYSVAAAWNLNVSRVPKRLDLTSVITRVIEMELLIGNVYPVTKRSLSRYLCRAVSMAWSISVKCDVFHANICIYVVFPRRKKKKGERERLVTEFRFNRYIL